MRCIPKSILVAAAAVATLLISTAHAQSTKRYEFGRDSRTKQILFIKNKKAYTPRYERGLTLKSGVQTLAAAPYRSLTDSTIKTDPVLAADKFLRSNASKFGVSAGSLYPQKVEIDNIGMAHVRYQQRYRDIPVFGGGLIVHVGANNIVTAANGRVARRISAYVPSERLRLSEDEVREIARNFWFAEYGREVTPVVEVRGSYIYSPTFLGTVNYSLNATPSPAASPRPSASPYGSSTPAPTSTPRVSSRLSYGEYVYRVVAHSEETHNAQIYFVDGRTGELRGRESGVHGISRVVLDCSPFPTLCVKNFTTSEYPGYTFGRTEGMPARGACPVEKFSGMTDVDRLYDTLGDIHNYYVSRLGRDGGNGQGGLNYGDGNAHTGIPWSSATVAQALMAIPNVNVGETCPQKGTGFYLDRAKIVFCYGDVVNDIVGHEYSHSLPFYAHTDSGGAPIGMTYVGESGALVESNSDVFGEFFEFFRSGATDWAAGSGSMKGIIRDIANPHNGTFARPSGHPDRFNSSLTYCGADDNNGVHFNSTIISHAFYLLSTGTRFNGCTIQTVPHERLEQILYRAVTRYYSQSETFNAAYNSLIQACNDLYSNGGSTCNSITAALQAVELDQPGGCSDIEPRLPSCFVPEPVCTDTDGDTPATFGTVNVRGQLYADRCLNPTTLSEAVCDGSNVAFKNYTCNSECTPSGGAHCQ